MRTALTEQEGAPEFLNSQIAPIGPTDLLKAEDQHQQAAGTLLHAEWVDQSSSPSNQQTTTCSVTPNLVKRGWTYERLPNFMIGYFPT